MSACTVCANSVHYALRPPSNLKTGIQSSILQMSRVRFREVDLSKVTQLESRGDEL